MYTEVIIEDETVQDCKAKCQENFAKCVKGYHLLNTEPLNETIWETINSQVLIASGFSVSQTSSGSHTSGKDITCSFGGLSNKSSKYTKNKTEFAISSYRLTTVCNDRDCGDEFEITKEINSRKNYDYYSFIVRHETGENIEYDWYLIPSDYPALCPETYKWEKMTGQRGRKTGEIVGWKTDTVNGSKMSISFSMSSQLWITLSVTEQLKEFIVASVTVKKQAKLNYIDIFNLHSH